VKKLRYKPSTKLHTVYFHVSQRIGFEAIIKSSVLSQNKKEKCNKTKFRKIRSFLLKIRDLLLKIPCCLILFYTVINFVCEKFMFS